MYSGERSVPLGALVDNLEWIEVNLILHCLKDRFLQIKPSPNFDKETVGYNFSQENIMLFPHGYALNMIFWHFLYARLQTGRIMVWWCPSVRVSVRPSIRLSQFSALFSYMLWHIDLKFCVSLYFYARKIKFECHQFPSLFAGVMLLFNFKLLQICSFPHFSPF